MSTPADLLAALSAMEALFAALGALRGDPLQPHRRPEDRLDGCGALAAALATHPAPPALAAHPDAHLAFWDQLAAADPACERLLALLALGWGHAAARDQRWPQAAAWTQRALAWMRRFLARPGAAALALQDPALDPDAAARLTDKLLRRWLDHEADAALDALEGRCWPALWPRWATIAAQRPLPAAEDAAARLAAALLRHLDALAHAGAERGVERGLDDAHHLLASALAADPDAAPLHQRRLDLGLRAALAAWARRDLTRFDQLAAALAPSLRLLDPPDAAPPDDLTLREHLAQGYVCLAATHTHPADAAAALRRALQLDPHHPTAAALLGQALCALAARRLGAARLDEARAALDEGLPLHPNPDDRRLRRLRDLILARHGAAP